MKDLADRSRANVQALVRQALVGSSLQQVTYAIAYWELMFLALDDVKVVASEIVLPDQTTSEEETRRVVDIGSHLLALTNTSPVSSVDVHASGELDLTFLKGERIRVPAKVRDVDWTWSIEAPGFRFTCDGLFSD